LKEAHIIVGIAQKSTFWKRCQPGNSTWSRQLSQNPAQKRRLTRLPRAGFHSINPCITRQRVYQNSFAALPEKERRGEF
jgi:hypothetical protein